MKFDDEIITITDAATHCKVTRATIWRWIKSGVLDAGVTAGGHHRIRREDLFKLIKAKGMNSRSRRDSNPFKVLVVDDDPSVRNLLGTALKKSGYDIAYAADGFDAGLKIIQFEPHIMILDIFMSKMDGFEVCQRLKENIDSVNIKIIAISGPESKDTQQQIFRCGADRFFKKPLDLKKLVREIDDLIGASASGN